MKIIKQLEEVNNLLKNKFNSFNIQFNDFYNFLIENKLKENDFILMRQYLFGYYFLKIRNDNLINEKKDILKFCKVVNQLFKSTINAINPVILRRLIPIIKPMINKQVIKKEVIKIGLFSLFENINKEYNLEI